MGLVAVGLPLLSGFLWMPGKTHGLHRIESDNADELSGTWFRGFVVALRFSLGFVLRVSCQVSG